MKQIYIVGPMGSRREEVGVQISKEKGIKLFDLDKEIEKEDGRTIKKISMMMGEHAYHDKEYHKLREFQKMEEFVLVCGDGVLFDSMCQDIIEKGQVIVADFQKSPKELWESTKKNENLPYAFVNIFRQEEKKWAEGETPMEAKEKIEAAEKKAYKKFLEVYNARVKYFEKFI